jgi:hypothetical protein
MRERVTLHGILRGKEGEAPCTLSNAGAFSDNRVDPQSIDVFSPIPIPLPDGNYDLFLEGKCYYGRLENGHL